MKVLSFALSTIMSCSVIANEGIIDYAQTGVDYESIVINLAMKTMSS